MCTKKDTERPGTKEKQSPPINLTVVNTQSFFCVVRNKLKKNSETVIKSFVI